MSLLQPVSTDLMQAPSHSFQHRVIACDSGSPVQSIAVGATGNVAIKESIEMLNNKSIYFGLATVTDTIRATADSDMFAIERYSGSSWEEVFRIGKDDPYIWLNDARYNELHITRTSDYGDVVIVNSEHNRINMGYSLGGADTTVHIVENRSKIATAHNGAMVQIENKWGSEGTGEGDAGIELVTYTGGSTRKSFSIYVDNSDSDKLKFYDISNSKDLLTFDANGNAGFGGVTDPDEAIEVNGAVHLDQVTAPGTTTDKLYNVSGSLVWNGSQLIGATRSENVTNSTMTEFSVTVAGTNASPDTTPYLESTYKYSTGTVSGPSDIGFITRTLLNRRVESAYYDSGYQEAYIEELLGYDPSGEGVNIRKNFCLPDALGDTPTSYLRFDGKHVIINPDNEAFNSFTVRNNSIDLFRVNTASGTVTAADFLTVSTIFAKFGGTLLIKEQASASSIVDTYGNIWVKSDTPNTLWFTDDAGTDVQLGTGGVGGSGTTNDFAIWSSSSALGTGSLSWVNGDPTHIKVDDSLYVTGNTGLGTNDPNAKFEVVDTSQPQVRISYDGSNYASLATDSGGILTITPTSSIMKMYCNSAVTTSATFRIASTNQYTDFIQDAADNWFRIDNSNGNGIVIKTSSLTIGNDSSSGDVGTNYSKFESDGTLVFAGAAIVYDDMQVSISNIKLPVSNAPTDRLYDHGVSGGVTFPVLGFEVDDYFYFDVQTSHSMKLNTILDNHIHFILPNTTDIGDKWKFQLDVIVAGIGAQWAVPTGSPFTAEHTIVANDDSYHRLMDVGDIPSSNTTVSTIYKCKLTRIAASADEYASEVYIEFTDCHYQKDMCGSRNETSK